MDLVTEAMAVETVTLFWEHIWSKGDKRRGRGRTCDDQHSKTDRKKEPH